MAITIRLQAGEKKTIFSRNLSSIPRNFQFQALALNNQVLDGDIEIRGSKWIFRTPPVLKRLQANNSVYAGFWDTFFSVTVIAQSDIELSIPRHSSVTKPKFMWTSLLAVLIIVLALGIFLLSL